MIGFDELGRKGWLGNTMFQYAALKGIAAHHGYEYCIPPNDDTRVANYLLHDIFKLPDVKNVGYIRLSTYRHSTSDDPCHSTTFNYNQQFMDECPDNVTICGFFQSEKWFKHIEKDVHRDFEFVDEIQNECKELIDSLDQTPIFLHVRRGDFVKKPQHHYNLPLEYFGEALSHFNRNIPVLVFSDDIEWCKSQSLFEPDRFYFSETDERLPNNAFIRNQGYEQSALIPYNDLCLMSLCDGGIISNSSFSWWGAWLQQNRTRPIVCPNKDKWGGSLCTLDHSDVCPDSWIKL